MASPNSLLMTEDEHARDFLRGVLSKHGFHVTLASTGHGGMEQFSPGLFQLVVVDLQLTDVSGLEILRKVKRQSPETAVIMISDSLEVNEVLHTIRLGACDYFLKPIEQETLMDRAICRISEAENLAQQNREYRQALECRNRELSDHIELLRRDQEAGRLLQQHLLPRTPYRYPGGVEAAYFLVPSLYLSGDFVDYGLFGERFVAFYLVDVSGHGVSSALVTALIKHSIMHCLRERPLFTHPEFLNADLLEMLDLINRELLSTPMDKHASMFVGVIDTAENQLLYSVAGQIPMPALVTAGDAEWLAGKGRPLGIFERGDWQVMCVELPSNWQLVACSDGVLELLQGNLLEKEARLLQLIAESGGELEQLRKSLKVDTYGALPDDMTILTLGHK
ncbi:fused response regulator/phosphatase [uncultured Microbulbifer sp.]|uniref:PP2C family protein-serine/threonine phosphatase n=1 Tax=uncultured Microbulbifer sp. TaxID=348147 RepID=UPI002605C707|nr:fused response regulator/phosphatase [uncultured Microbulbifer sp.]